MTFWPHREAPRGGTSYRSDWVTDHLWIGAVPYFGPAAAALVGSAEEIVEAIYGYRSVGIIQFLFVGYPDDREQLRLFGEEILPRLRDRGTPGGLSTFHSRGDVTTL